MVSREGAKKAQKAHKKYPYAPFVLTLAPSREIHKTMAPYLTYIASRVKTERIHQGCVILS